MTQALLWVAFFAAAVWIIVHLEWRFGEHQLWTGLFAIAVVGKAVSLIWLLCRVVAWALPILWGEG